MIKKRDLKGGKTSKMSSCILQRPYTILGLDQIVLNFWQGAFDRSSEDTRLSS